ncbi:MAG: hypothetical protein JW901_05810 [Dehalococcoidia bacterium]|nr:hypothetical protein [Dehalococcoidia bacterium]
MLTNQFTLTRAGALSWLRRLEEKPPVFTAYFAAAASIADTEKMLLEVLDRGQVLDEICGKVGKAPAGAAVFYISGKAWVVWPPFPLDESRVVRSYEPAALEAVLERDWRLALVLVRLGRYAIGVFHGEKLIDCKAGTGLVHARHHKGGSSANRFARHREKQMESFFTRVEVHAREILEPHLKEIDYVIYGGTRETLQTMRSQCRFFSNLQSKSLGRLLSVREPRRSTLGEANAQAYASTVFEITE